MTDEPEGELVQIYTDGGCDPNPGPGGWGAVLIYGLKTLELSGADPDTTNNRMELTAAIQALRALKRPCTIVLHTDSRYLQKGIHEWLPTWRQHHWLKANGRPVENQDLWQALDEQVSRHHVSWQWVKGHQGHPLNERADELATEARERGRTQPSPTAHSSHSAISSSQLPRVAIYCRACALGVPGPAGYAAVLVREDGTTSLVSGGWSLASSNAMELWAAIAGLRALKERSQVTIFTSSKYVYDNITKRLADWERNHWRTSEGQPVKNQEMWRELASVQGDHNITWKYLGAHLSNEHSERAARAARQEAEKQAEQQSR